MSLTLREAVERMNAYLEAHPDRADCPVYAHEWDDPEFSSQGSELDIELPDGFSDTILTLS